MNNGYDSDGIHELDAILAAPARPDPNFGVKKDKRVRFHDESGSGSQKPKPRVRRQDPPQQENRPKRAAEREVSPFSDDSEKPAGGTGQPSPAGHASGQHKWRVVNPTPSVAPPREDKYSGATCAERIYRNHRMERCDTTLTWSTLNVNTRVSCYHCARPFWKYDWMGECPRCKVSSNVRKRWYLCLNCIANSN